MGYYVDTISISIYNLYVYRYVYIQYIYISTYGRLILASGFLFNKKIDLPSKSNNELFQDRT